MSFSGPTVIAAGGAVVATGIYYIYAFLQKMRNAESVKNKVVLLTGASSGLGEGEYNQEKTL